MSKNYFPGLIKQNPSLPTKDSQDRRIVLEDLTDKIMSVYMQLLPSNYVSQTNGPTYTVLFRSFAEQLASLQLEAQELYGDLIVDVTRSEFLYDMIGSLIFPDADIEGMPQINGDVTYRDFLGRMLVLVLRGSKIDAVEEALSLLDKSVSFEVIEKYLSGDLTQQHIIDVFVSNENKFPEEPFILQNNVKLVLKALKPAHIFYEYKNLFSEIVDEISESVSYNHDNFYYEDYRKYCSGLRQISGSLGETLENRFLFRDVTRSFDSVKIGSNLTILTGDNSTSYSSDDSGRYGHYKVTGLPGFPYPNDNSAVPFITQPSDFNGILTVTSEYTFEGIETDIGLWSEGEVLIIESGLNKGSYRVSEVLGNNGGFLGRPNLNGYIGKISKCILKLNKRMPKVQSEQEYVVSLDHEGIQDVNVVTEEDCSNQFYPSSTLENSNVIYVSKGPLVKNWGDSTLATKNDVVVYVNGSEVEVESVNPYLSEITLSEPVALSLDNEVLVDYFWISTPTVFSEFNVDGSNYNLYQNYAGGFFSSVDGTGLLSSNKFPFSTVYGPFLNSIEPLRYAHRFLAYDKHYSSLYNNQSTLVFNANTRKSPFSLDLRGVNENYDGLDVPSNWVQSTNYIPDVSDGVVTLNQEQFYSRGENLNFPLSIYYSLRFKIDDSDREDQVTGVSFGFHNEKSVFMFGVIYINDLSHVAILKDPYLYESLDGWEVLGKIRATAKSQSSMILDSIPFGFKKGKRFQVLVGNQIGVYTLTSVEDDVINFTPNLPQNIKLYGNKIFYVYPELKIDSYMSSFSLNYLKTTDTLNLYISSDISYDIYDMSEASVGLPKPENIGLVQTFQKGSFFWGNLKNNRESQWSFVRYGITPEMSFLKERHIEQSFSFESDPLWAQILSNGAISFDNSVKLLSPNGHLSYVKTEPFLNNSSYVILDSTFQSIWGSGIFFQIGTGTRLVSLANLYYIENGTRVLYQPSFVSWYSGDEFDWENTNLCTKKQNLRFLNLTNFTGSDQIKTILELNDLDSSSKFLELKMRLNIDSDTPVIYFESAGKSPVLRWSENAVEVHYGNDSISTLVETYSFDWDDNQFHIYKLIFDDNSGDVSLLIDGELQSPTLNTSDFGSSDIDDNTLFFKGWEGSDLDLEWVVYGAIPSSDVKRTFGLLSTGDPSNINSWKIPRSDSTLTLNSNIDSASVIEMDWTQSCEFRLKIDPAWGVSFVRPDLDIPDGYENDAVVGGGFSTAFSVPSAAYINLETPKIPYNKTTFGYISLSSSSNQEYIIGPISYQISAELEPEFVTRQMSYNKANTVTSSEHLIANSPQQSSVVTLDFKTINLYDHNIFAKTIYKVLDGSVIYTYPDIEFKDNIITLNALEGQDRSFEHSELTVVYSISKPTLEQLQNLPFSEGDIILNDTTPPFFTGHEIDELDLIDFTVTTKNLEDAVEQDFLDYARHKKTYSEGSNDFYRSLEWVKKSNDGENNLLSWPQEATIRDNLFEGWSFDAGEVVYDSNGDLTDIFVGIPVGGYNLWFSGYYENISGRRDRDVFNSYGSLFVGGGSYRLGRESKAGKLNYNLIINPKGPKSFYKYTNVSDLDDIYTRFVVVHTGFAKLFF